MKGTAPSPRALTAGRDKLPPSMRFQTTCSVLKFFAGARLYISYPFMSPTQNDFPTALFWKNADGLLVGLA